jgi:hypothetical protein
MADSKAAFTASLPGIGVSLGAGAGMAVGVAVAGGPGVVVGLFVGAAAGLVIGSIAATARRRSGRD